MSKRNNHEIAAFTIFMIIINYLGKLMANHFSLPVWMDSLGTVVAAYVCDPFCGAVVGFSSNLLYGLKDPSAVIYGLTSIIIGVTVGIMARKKMFESVFGTLTVSVIVTLFSVVISTPLNMIFNHGEIGNIWGDSVSSYLLENEMNPYICSSVGEFYVDFLDKVITLMVLFILIRLSRALRHNSLDGATEDETVKETETEKTVDMETGKNTKKGKKRSGKKIRSILMLIIISFGIFSASISAKAESSNLFSNYIQMVYSSDNGLPCGEANDIIQSNDGILWVGTYAGLYRYNGVDFSWMSDYSAVRNVNCLYMDEEGRIWIGTNDNGLSIAINGKVTNVIDEDGGLPANSVRCITRDSAGNYYIGTTSGMITITLRGGLDIVCEFPEIIYAHSIAADSNDNIATVTNDGKLFLVNGSEVIDSLKSDAEQEIFTCCTFDKDGILYVGTSSNNIYCYKISSGKLERTNMLSCGQLNNINRIYISDDDKMFVCADDGAGYFDKFNKLQVINTGGFNNSIDNMVIDYQGNLWFSSSRLGLLKLSQSAFVNMYQVAGIESSVANTVAMWQGRMYVGTDKGLDIINMDLNAEIEDELTERLNEVRIRCIKADKKGNLWICTYGKGLYKVTPEGEVTVFDSTDNVLGDWVRVVIELSDGEMLASCDTGISFFKDDKVNTNIPYGQNFSNAMILCMEELDDNRIMCGTDGDGIAIIKDKKVVKKLTRRDGLSSDVILRIVEDPVEKGVYIVTSNGLCYMDGNGQISLLENFPYSNNYDIYALDDGKLFVLSSAGIYVMKRDQLFNEYGEPEYELLDAKRGLKAALTANSWDYLDDLGNLYLSCDSGIYRMNIYDYKLTRKSYRMMVSTISLDGVNHSVERGETFHIDRNVKKIEIYPEVINYTVYDPKVSYYLEGFDLEPTVVYLSTLTSVVYTNLPAGDYKFHIRVLDNNDEQVLEESVYELSRDSEIYDERWFHIYMFVVAMLAVAWFTWFVVRTQIQRTLNFQKKELEFARNQLKMGNETILAIAKTVDAKDENTSLHSQRVSDYSVMIAREFGFDDKECENLKKAALLHDIGKIGIPDKVLNKPDKLDDKEYEIMKSHVTRGAKILKDFTLVEHAIEGTLYHHERYDGKGYPQGLSGEAIPLYGRIIGVADAFDAMTANRVYRKQLDFDIVLKELKRCRGTQFDPQLLDILLKLIEEGRIDVDALYGKPVLKDALQKFKEDDGRETEK